MITHSVKTVIFSFVQAIYQGPDFLRLNNLCPFSFWEGSVYNTIQSFEKRAPLEEENVTMLWVFMSIKSPHLIVLIVEKNIE